jgi:redox-sensitive bicupin YhaK (pirin superfamily)
VIQHRPASTRGFAELPDSIASYRTFTFGTYRDWRYMNYSSLETINDDRVMPGFHTQQHIHTNREIFGYVVSGSCRHTDVFGNVIDIPAGAVQRMCAGSGLKHTEGNATDEPIRYLQLWIRSDKKNYTPSWDWHQFTRADKLNKFCDITARLPINSNSRLLAGIFTDSYSYKINTNRRYYLYVVNGEGTINGIGFLEGDGFAFEQEQLISVTVATESELILFDLP